MSFKSGMKGADVVALLKNGLPIVDDVNKLDPNAEVGSMASVVTSSSLQETSIRNLYQPDASMLDQTAGILTQPELLSSVSSIKVFVPTDVENIGFEPVESAFCLVPRDFSMTNETMAMIELSLEYGGVMGMIMVGGQDTMQQFVFVEFPSDTSGFIVHDDQVEAFNAILANGMDWCYFSDPSTFNITEDQFNTIDLFVNASVGMPNSVDIYAKGDTWERLYEKDLNIVLGKIDTVTNALRTKANSIPVNSADFLSGTIEPNIYYKITCSNIDGLTYYLRRPIDASVYSEYTIQLTCEETPSSVKFKDDDYNELPIKWNNGIEPVFVGGCTYIISIVDNFGVFAQYINS